MFRCPKCNEKIFEDSAICPNCGAVVNEGVVSGINEELERISQMVFNMEYDLGAIGDYTPAVDPNKPKENTPAFRPYNDKGFLDEQEGYEEENLIIEEAPVVFTASKSGVQQVVDEAQKASFIKEEQPEIVESDEDDKYGISVSDDVLKEIEELQKAEQMLKEALGDELIDDATLDTLGVDLFDLKSKTEEIKESTEEVQEELTEEIQEEPTVEVQEELTEEIQEESTEEVQEEPTEEVQEEPTEEVQEEPTEEVQEEPTEEVQEEPTEEVQEEPTEEVQEEPTEEVQEESTEEVQEELSEEVQEELTEEIQEELTEEIQEEPTEEIQEEPTEEVQEEPTEDLADIDKNSAEVDFFDSIKEPAEAVYDKELEDLMTLEHEKFFSEIDILEPFSNDDSEEYLTNTSSTIDFFDFDKINDTFNSTEEIYTKEELDYFKYPAPDEVEPDYNRAEAEKTYLKLNFVSIEKFATLISSENEKLDLEESRSSTYDNRYVDLLDIDAIIHSEQLSDEELEATMRAVLNQKDEMKQSQERAEKDQKINNYKEVRHRLMNGIRIVGAFIIILFCFYLYSYISDSGNLDLKSELYQKDTIEEYDRVLYESSDKIVKGENEVYNLFNQYKNGEMSEDDFRMVCLEYKSKLIEYDKLYNNVVYDEAEDYLFANNNVYFFANYYLDNILAYLDTNDEYYLQLNDSMVSENNALIKEEMEARHKFLKDVGFTDEEIEILDLKLSESPQE